MIGIFKRFQVFVFFPIADSDAHSSNYCWNLHPQKESAGTLKMIDRPPSKSEKLESKLENCWLEL